MKGGQREPREREKGEPGGPTLQLTAPATMTRKGKRTHSEAQQTPVGEDDEWPVDWLNRSPEDIPPSRAHAITETEAVNGPDPGAGPPAATDELRNQAPPPPQKRPRRNIARSGGRHPAPKAPEAPEEPLHDMNHGLPGHGGGGPGYLAQGWFGYRCAHCGWPIHRRKFHGALHRSTPDWSGWSAIAPGLILTLAPHLVWADGLGGFWAVICKQCGGNGGDRANHLRY